MNKISIFIHAAILNKCKERIIQYIQIIQESKLINNIDKIYICFVGNENIPINNTDLINYNCNIKLIKVSNNLHDYEIPTLEYLYNFCKNNLNYNVLYLHTKNVGKELNHCIEDQIKYMLFFNVLKWEECQKTLTNNNTCGVDLLIEPNMHYSGNFWWSKSSHISSLPSPLEFNNLEKFPNNLNSLRHNQEFWICYNKNNHYSLWNSNINCYERHLHLYPEEKYNFYI